MYDIERHDPIDAFWDENLRRLPKQNSLFHRNPMRSALFIADLYPAVYPDYIPLIDKWRENPDVANLDSKSLRNAEQVQHRKAALEWLILLHGPGEPENDPQYVSILQKLTEPLRQENLAEVRVAWWGEQIPRFNAAMQAIGGAALNQIRDMHRGVADHNPNSSFYAVYYPANAPMPDKVGVVCYENNEVSRVDLHQPGKTASSDVAIAQGMGANFWRGVFKDQKQSTDLPKVNAASVIS